MKLNEEGLNAKFSGLLEHYKCHKVVRAGKIEMMAADQPNGVLMVHCEPSLMPISVPLDFLQRHAPERGGYLVVYEDGYLSYSPAETFEAGYRKLEPVGCSSGSVGGDADATDLKETFLNTLRRCEQLAFDYSHSLPAGPDRELAIQVYHRVRMVFANGKGGVVATGCHVENPVTNLVGATGGPEAEPVAAEPLVADIPPHQLRVLEELHEVSTRFAKLTEFTGTALFASLDEKERERLIRQVNAMSDYVIVLGERVAAF